MRKNARFFRREKSWIWAAGLLCLGLALRLLFLEKLPYGLNQDEASAGYDAWALLQAGIDRNGKSWPVLFFSWGSGQNVLMSYLAMPFIALWGLRPLSLRLPNAIAGCVTLWGMWRLARKVRGEKFGLWALGLLAINPWHIMASRWGLESNLLPALLMGACFFLSRAEEKPKALFGVAVCLGLAPYAYGTAFFFLPPFLLWSVIRLRKSLRPGVTVLSLLLFSLLIFPIAYCQALNILGGEEKRLLGMTLPRLVDARQNATSILGGGGLGAVRKNVLTFLEILHNGDDQVEYNALPFWQGGILYFFGLPLAVLGVIRSIQERGKRPGEWPMLGWLGCAALCSALIDGNINRLNMVWIPMIYYSALGGFWLMDQLQLRRALPLAVAVLSFLYFGYNYSARFASPGHYKYFPGLGEAISRAEELSPETVYITSQVRQPYIFALFYTTPAPERFVESAVFQTDLETGMQTVDRMEGFEFAEMERADLWILTEGEAQEQQREILDTFGLYAVCR
ncbi:MAG: glycosyltransferase family 39 protein [Clostridia bacterium]|nr:glycosyltransferase family 39 protein [Clostridia bacterium]